MRTLDKIIFHCAFTPPQMDIGVEEIRQWHLAKGWADIGYHFVIRRDGSVETGRPIGMMGAHCLGQNANSIGVCLVGGMNTTGGPDSNFTLHQYVTVDSLKSIYSALTVHGHREFSPKDCPCFDVAVL
jgi:N-acetylmuramoyl-L-alanine amidase